MTLQMTRATRCVVKVGTVAMTTGRADKQRRHHRVVSDIVAACGQNRLTKSNVCRRRAPNDPPSGRRPVLQRSLQHAPVRTADQIEGPCAAAAYGCGYASRKALAGPLPFRTCDRREEGRAWSQ